MDSVNHLKGFHSLPADSELATEVVVIGGGFAGQSAAYELGRQGIHAVVLEQEDDVGGAAGSFQIGGQAIEKFYHHWFTNDEYVKKLAEELGCQSRILHRPVQTGTYINGDTYRLSSPWDLLRFKPLTWIQRIRLGLLVLQARRIKDHRALVSMTAEEWLINLCGKTVYKVVWEPLLRGKFGSSASEISAVWIWNKLALRGSSRDQKGNEVLLYYQGGMKAFLEEIVQAVVHSGGDIRTSTSAKEIVVRDGRVEGVRTENGLIQCKAVVSTVALPTLAEMLKTDGYENYKEQLKRIRYLSNICVVLELRNRLSDLYWLNINDAGCPFVGVIEHTNFQSPNLYGDRHIVYLSRYCLDTDELYRAERHVVENCAMDQLKKLFPLFNRSDVCDCHVWKYRYAQPIVNCDYARHIPDLRSPVAGLYTASMAQIYPEDRGTNYAIRMGREAACLLGQERKG